MKKELIIKRNGFSNKEELIEHLLIAKSDIDSLIEILRSPQKLMEDKILIQYILTQSGVKTCELLNREGYKTTNGKKYYPKDITDVIKNGSEKVNLTLLNLAGQIFDKNWKSVSKHHN